jgi:NAD(P)-dependent dehydrogenase (short-subunit alcohol dehydrogenase family)
LLLTDLVAIITGGGAGIGRRLVHALLGAGAKVVAADINREALEELKQINAQALDNLRCCVVDLTEADGPPTVVAEALRSFGKINSLVNNAGIGRVFYAKNFLVDPPKAWEISIEVWRHFFEVNTLSAIRMTQEVVPQLLAEGWGRIINVTTSLDSMLHAGSGPYGPSKAALESFSAVVGNELAGTGVTVNVLIPGGPVDTAMIPNVEGVARPALLDPDVMVAPLLWLMSPESDGVTGRRFRANRWNPNRPPEVAATEAGAPIAWSSIAAGQMRTL